MNPELPPNPRAELEARVTALLLGELSAAEAASMRELIAKDAELGRLRDRLSLTLDLLRETAATPVGETPAQPAALKLSPARREKLLAHFKTIAPKEFAPPPRWKMSWLVPLAAAAAVVLLASLFMPALSRSKSTLSAEFGDSHAPWYSHLSLPSFTKARTSSQQNSIVNNLRLLDSAKQQWAVEQRQLATAVPTMDDLRPYFGHGAGGELPSVAGERYYLGAVGQQPVAQLKNRIVTLPGEEGNLAVLNTPAPALVAQASTLRTKLEPPPMSPASPANQTVLEDLRERRLSENAPAAAPSANQIVLPQSSEQQLAVVNNQDNNGAIQLNDNVRGGGGGFSFQTAENGNRRQTKPPPAMAVSGGIAGTVASTMEAESASARTMGFTQHGIAVDKLDLESAKNVGRTRGNIPVEKDSHNVFVAAEGVPVPVAASAPPPIETADNFKGALANADAAPAALPPVSSAGKQIEQSDAPLPRPVLPAPVPQAEVLTRDNAFTTFSLNVSDVAFKLAAASLQNGVMPEAASMRSEEFINTFDYRDPETGPRRAHRFCLGTRRQSVRPQPRPAPVLDQDRRARPPGGPSAQPGSASRQIRLDGTRRPRRNHFPGFARARFAIAAAGHAQCGGVRAHRPFVC